jgi:hypothetical protein
MNERAEEKQLDHEKQTRTGIRTERPASPFICSGLEKIESVCDDITLEPSCVPGHDLLKVAVINSLTSEVGKERKYNQVGVKRFQHKRTEAE